MSNRTFSTQSIGFSSVINARDLGGYEMKDGRRVRRGLLLRGGDLSRLTDAEMQRLTDFYGLQKVFDFRTLGEVSYAPDRKIEGVRNVWLPAIDPRTEAMADRSLPTAAYRDLENFLLDNCSNLLVQSIASRIYTDMVDNEYTQLQYASFLQLIATQKDGAVFWHCSQGKDRTGLGAAFILFALGASRETVLEDYLISNEFYEKDVVRLCEEIDRRGGGEAEKAVIKTFVGVNADYFNAALDLIDEKYGSMDSYLSDQLLLGEDLVEKLRARLLE